MQADPKWLSLGHDMSPMRSHRDGVAVAQVSGQSLGEIAECYGSKSRIWIFQAKSSIGLPALAFKVGFTLPLGDRPRGWWGQAPESHKHQPWQLGTRCPGSGEGF